MAQRTRAIWFNRGLATVYDQLRIIRENDVDRRFHLLASIRPEPNAVATVADELFDEAPSTVSDQAYVDWCLDVCRSRGIDLFVPSRRRDAIAARSADFGGTALAVPGTPEVLRLLEQKDEFYGLMAAEGVPVAPFRTFATLAEFDRAREELGDAPLCIKPVNGIFASGFYRLIESDDEYRRLIESQLYQVSWQAFRRMLESAPKPRPYLLMHYLPGIERSVDCLAHKGTLVAAIGRVKQGSAQRIETTGPAIEIARALVERFTLDGVINVQTRDDANGVPHVLEINARASGGLPFGALASCPLPYWAAMLALGLAEPADVPQPTPGLLVAPVTAAVRVPDTALIGD